MNLRQLFSFYNVSFISFAPSCGHIGKPKPSGLGGNARQGCHWPIIPGLVASTLLAIATPQPSQALLLLKLEEVGQNVVVTGSGSVNLSALMPGESRNDFTNVFTSTLLFAGPAAFDNGLVTFWSGLSLTGPLSIGSDPLFTDNPTSGSGDLFGLVSNDNSGENGDGKPLIVLPQGYISGTSLSGTSTFFNLSFADMGLSVGTSTYSWGSGDTADSLRVQVGPDEVPAPLGFAGAGAAFSCVRRLKRNSLLLQQHANKTTA
jgi:hypothetical protein